MPSIKELFYYSYFTQNLIVDKILPLFNTLRNEGFVVSAIFWLQNSQKNVEQCYIAVT